MNGFEASGTTRLRLHCAEEASQELAVRSPSDQADSLDSRVLTIEREYWIEIINKQSAKGKMTRCGSVLCRPQKGKALVPGYMEDNFPSLQRTLTRAGGGWPSTDRKTVQPGDRLAKRDGKEWVMKCFRGLWLDSILDFLTWQVGLYLMAQSLVRIVNYNHQHSENSGSRKARTLGTQSGTRPISTRATMRRGRDEWIAEEPATHPRAFLSNHSFPFPFPPSHMPCLEMVPSDTKTNIPLL